MKEHRKVQYYSEQDPIDSVQSVSFIRYDVHGKPTYFEVPRSIVTITEEHVISDEEQRP